MIVALLNLYLVILFILVKTKIVPFNLFWKCPPLIVLLLLMFGLFIPMGWGAPQGPSLVVRNSVQIVPNVAGEVTEVPVDPNKPLKAGACCSRSIRCPTRHRLIQSARNSSSRNCGSRSHSTETERRRTRP